MIRWIEKSTIDVSENFQLKALRAVAQKGQGAWETDVGCCSFSAGGRLLLQTLSPY